MVCFIALRAYHFRLSCRIPATVQRPGIDLGPGRQQHLAGRTEAVARSAVQRAEAGHALGLLHQALLLPQKMASGTKAKDTLGRFEDGWDSDTAVPVAKVVGMR